MESPSKPSTWPRRRPAVIAAAAATGLYGDSGGGGSRNKTNWASLRVFESGDVADKEAWDMSVKYLQNSGAHCWKVEREGVLVKQEDGDTAAPNDQTGAASHPPTTTGGNTLLV